MAWLVTIALALALAACGRPTHEQRHRAQPACQELRRTARHELGDPGGEIERHCRRDQPPYAP
jgi:hypothetical protein